MPGSGDYNRNKILEAVRAGQLSTEKLDEARQQAKAAEVAIVFAGLPDSYESEGFDRASVDLPAGHIALIDAVSAVQPSTVLMNGSAVTMPWAGITGDRGSLVGWSDRRRRYRRCVNRPG
jgi:beta-glucosidase